MSRRYLVGLAFVAMVIGQVALAEDVVRAAPAEPGQATPLAVAIPALKIEGSAVPAWFGLNLQQTLVNDVAEMPDVNVSRLTGRGEYWPTPAYVISGTCRQTPGGVLLECEVINVSDQRVEVRVGTEGTSADLMAMKDEIRRQMKGVLKGLTAPEPPAVVASATLTPASTQPAGTPVTAQSMPGGDYENSSLRWALENPEDFDRELDYWSRRSTLPARYGVLNYAGPYGQLGGYPFVRYPRSYVLVPGERKPFGRFQFPYTYSITQTPPKNTGK